MQNPFEAIEIRLSGIEKEIKKLNHSTPAETTTEEDEKFDAQQAAEFLNITLPTLYAKNCKGELPSCKAPGSKRLFFFKSDLITYLKEGRKKTNSERLATASQHLKK